MNSLYHKEELKVENFEIDRSESEDVGIAKYRDRLITSKKNQGILKDNILIEKNFRSKKMVFQVWSAIMDQRLWMKFRTI